MRKEKFEIEYTFKKGSLSILWNLISTPLGLSEWFADSVNSNENKYFFTWQNHEQTANVLNIKNNLSICFQWEEDERTDFYFELKIVTMELSGDLALIVTDFAEPSEITDSKFFWDHLIEILRRRTGM